MIQPIVAYGHPILRIECIDAVPGPETDACVKDLIDTLAGTGLTGLGLAAPQINVGRRIFVHKSHNTVRVIINPKIKKRRVDLLPWEEGCLSIPNIYRKLKVRSKRVEVEYFDEKFELQKLKFDGRDSVVFQHEMDHINGIHFIDYLTPEQRSEIMGDLNKITIGDFTAVRKPDYDMLLASGEVVKKNA